MRDRKRRAAAIYQRSQGVARELQTAVQEMQKAVVILRETLQRIDKRIDERDD